MNYKAFYEQIKKEAFAKSETITGASYKFALREHINRIEKELTEEIKKY